MNSTQQGREGMTDQGTQGRFSSVLATIRRKLGASPRQLMIFGLLLAVAGTMWARPAATLLWHRLRIITGMPRMAVADEDPELVADAGEQGPERLDAGEAVELDEILHRDPFKRTSTFTMMTVAGSSETGSGGMREVRELDPDSLVSIASNIRLTGTAKGLGTALLDGRARAIGDHHEAGGALFRLAEVMTGVVILETTSKDGTVTYRFQLDKSGAKALSSDN